MPSNPKPLSAKERAEARSYCFALLKHGDGIEIRLARYCNRALDDLERAGELLIKLHTNHYEPLYGGYCWCCRPRLNGVPPHEANCLTVRTYFASAEEGK